VTDLETALTFVAGFVACGGVISAYKAGRALLQRVWRHVALHHLRGFTGCTSEMGPQGPQGLKGDPGEPGIVRVVGAPKGSVITLVNQETDEMLLRAIVTKRKKAEKR
jgi:hypothetical protein